VKQAYFRFSKEILFRLGEELNPSPDQSIIELVKNAYDADARNCVISITNTDNLGGTIRIVDDGDGMDDEEIIDGWLVLGQSLKILSKKRTRLQRIPSGEKGLGRLAALRMGTATELVSRPRKKPGVQYHLRIDWAAFDNANLVDEVQLLIEESSYTGKTFGTEIKIENLKLRINRFEVKSLARSLLLLADPFTDDPEGFKPILEAPEFSDLENLVKNRYFCDAEYHLHASVDSKGIAHAIVADWKGEVIFKANHEELFEKNKTKQYSCPQTTFDLWAFILNKETFNTRTSSLKDVRKWLKSFGGVHLYHNGLRVNPYGNPGNDWLEMNLSRAKSPEERPSTNTSIGRVSISDPSITLIQKTDRSGIIESESFIEIKEFSKYALKWMAKRRLKMAESRRKKERTEAPDWTQKAKKEFEEAIAKSPESTRENLKKVFVKYDQKREKEVQTLRKEVQLYRTLSTAGITAATFAHESTGNQIKVISQSANIIERRGRNALSDKYDSTLKNPVQIIQKAVKALGVLGDVTLSLLEHEKRRACRVDVHKVIESVCCIFNPFLADWKVKLIKQFTQGNPYLKASEAAIEAIITNILNNCLNWFENVQSQERKIIIRTVIIDKMIEIRTLDNGPGIIGIDKNDIWLPGQTTRRNGTGLGLSIVHDIVFDLNGSVNAIEKGELGGAEIIVTLPIIGA